MKITDALLGEHGVFYAWFDRLEERLPALEHPEVARELAGMLAAALVSHARSEDELLFEELGRRLGEEAAPLAVMRLEHERIELELERAISAVRGADACEALGRAIERAREHFAKEERMLFPMAEELLGSSLLVSLGDRWAERRGVTLLDAAGRGA